jgi:hypothetical protein
MFYLSPEKVGDNAAILLFDSARLRGAETVYRRSRFRHRALLNAPGRKPYSRLRSRQQPRWATFGKSFWVTLQAPTVVAADAPRRLIESAAADGSRTGVRARDMRRLQCSFAMRRRRLIDARGWFNVLDADFNLHLKEDAVDRVTGTGDAHRQMLHLENTAGEAITIYSKESK